MRCVPTCRSRRRVALPCAPRTVRFLGGIDVQHDPRDLNFYHVLKARRWRGAATTRREPFAAGGVGSSQKKAPPKRGLEFAYEGVACGTSTRTRYRGLGHHAEATYFLAARR